MPVSPNIGQDYGQEVAEVYRDAELRILARITAALAAGIDSPDWELEALARAQAVRDFTIAELNRTNPKLASAMTAALFDAYDRGGAAALRDIGSDRNPNLAAPAARRAAVGALVADVARGVASTAPTILRTVDDLLRSTVAQAVAVSVSAGDTRTRAAQEALNRLGSTGISGVPVGRGTMNITDYVSMAVRTGAARSAIEGTTQTMLASGVDLVVIHPGPRACDICDTWARSILTIDPGGVAGTMTVDNVAAPGTVEVEVDGSLDDARDDGWGHPNCRCAVAAYLPGATDTGIIDRPPWDAEGYAAQQQQRVNERTIREAKTEQALALTPDARADADQAVADAQAAQREWMDSHPDLKRQYDREQVGRVI